MSKASLETIFTSQTYAGDSKSARREKKIKIVWTVELPNTINKTRIIDLALFYQT